MERDIYSGIIASEYDSSSPEELIKVRNPLDEAGNEIIRKKRAAIHRKEKREFRKCMADICHLKRRKSKRIGKFKETAPTLAKRLKSMLRSVAWVPMHGDGLAY